MKDSYVVPEISGAHFKFEVEEDARGYPRVEWGPASAAEELKVRAGMYGERIAKCSGLKGECHVDPVRNGFQPHYMFCYGVFLNSTPIGRGDSIWLPLGVASGLHSFFLGALRPCRKVLLYDDMVARRSGKVADVPDAVFNRLDDTSVVWVHSGGVDGQEPPQLSSIASWVDVYSSLKLALERLTWRYKGKRSIPFMGGGSMDSGMMEYLIDWLGMD